MSVISSISHVFRRNPKTVEKRRLLKVFNNYFEKHSREQCAKISTAQKVLKVLSKAPEVNKDEFQKTGQTFIDNIYNNSDNQGKTIKDILPNLPKKLAKKLAKITGKE